MRASLSENGSFRLELKTVILITANYTAKESQLNILHFRNHFSVFFKIKSTLK